MAKRLEIIFLFLVMSNFASVVMSGAKSGNASLYSPYRLSECGGISLHSKTWHLVYGDRLVFRHDVEVTDEILAIIDRARREGKFVAISQDALVKEKYTAHHMVFERERADYLCPSCPVSNSIWVTNQSIKFAYATISVDDFVYIRDSRLPSIIDDSELWRLTQDHIPRQIWITKDIANRLRELRSKTTKLTINETAFSAPGLDDEPGVLMNYLSPESLIAIPPRHN